MASMMPLAILVWNQRRIPFQWRLTMRAASIIGGAAVGGPPVPFLEERLGILGRLDVEFLEGEADAVCPPGLEVGGGEVVQLSALAVRQVPRVFEPEVGAVCH